MHNPHWHRGDTLTGILSAPVGAWAGWLLAAVVAFPLDVLVNGPDPALAHLGMAVIDAARAAVAGFVYGLAPATVALLVLRRLGWSNLYTCAGVGLAIALWLMFGGEMSPTHWASALCAGALGGVSAWLGSGGAADRPHPTRLAA